MMPAVGSGSGQTSYILQQCRVLRDSSLRYHRCLPNTLVSGAVLYVLSRIVMSQQNEQLKTISRKDSRSNSQSVLLL